MDDPRRWKKRRIRSLDEVQIGDHIAWRQRANGHLHHVIVLAVLFNQVEDRKELTVAAAEPVLAWPKANAEGSSSQLNTAVRERTYQPKQRPKGALQFIYHQDRPRRVLFKYDHPDCEFTPEQRVLRAGEKLNRLVSVDTSEEFVSMIFYGERPPKPDADQAAGRGLLWTKRIRKLLPFILFAPIHWCVELVLTIFFTLFGLMRKRDLTPQSPRRLGWVYRQALEGIFQLIPSIAYHTEEPISKDPRRLSNIVASLLHMLAFTDIDPGRALHPGFNRRPSFSVAFKELTIYILPWFLFVSSTVSFEAFQDVHNSKGLLDTLFAVASWLLLPMWAIFSLLRSTRLAFLDPNYAKAENVPSLLKCLTLTPYFLSRIFVVMMACLNNDKWHHNFYLWLSFFPVWYLMVLAVSEAALNSDGGNILSFLLRLMRKSSRKALFIFLFNAFLAFVELSPRPRAVFDTTTLILIPQLISQADGPPYYVYGIIASGASVALVASLDLKLADNWHAHFVSIILSFPISLLTLCALLWWYQHAKSAQHFPMGLGHSRLRFFKRLEKKRSTVELAPVAGMGISIIYLLVKVAPKFDTFFPQLMLMTAVLSQLGTLAAATLLTSVYHWTKTSNVRLKFPLATTSAWNLVFLFPAVSSILLSVIVSPILHALSITTLPTPSPALLLLPLSIVIISPQRKRIMGFSLLHLPPTIFIFAMVTLVTHLPEMRWSMAILLFATIAIDHKELLTTILLPLDIIAIATSRATGYVLARSCAVSVDSIHLCPSNSNMPHHHTLVIKIPCMDLAFRIHADILSPPRRRHGDEVTSSFQPEHHAWLSVSCTRCSRPRREPNFIFEHFIELPPDYTADRVATPVVPSSAANDNTRVSLGNRY